MNFKVIRPVTSGDVSKNKKVIDSIEEYCNELLEYLKTYEDERSVRTGSLDEDLKDLAKNASKAKVYSQEATNGFVTNYSALKKPFEKVEVMIEKVRLAATQAEEEEERSEVEIDEAEIKWTKQNKLRKEIAAALGLKDKGHATHGSNFDGNQTTEQLIDNLLKGWLKGKNKTQAKALLDKIGRAHV